MSFRMSLAAVVGILALPAAAGAEVIEGFNMTGDGLLTSSSLPLAPTTADPNVTAGSLYASTSPNYKPGTVQVPANDGPDGLVTDSSSANVYADFLVIPDAGDTISISALNVDIVFQNPGNEVDILYSTDGTLADATLADAITGIGTWSGQPETANLSGIAALQNIPSTVTTTFFVKFDNGAYQDRGITDGHTTFANSDALELVGTVTSGAPEPTSLSLLGAAAAALCVRRRRGARNQ